MNNRLHMRLDERTGRHLAWLLDNNKMEKTEFLKHLINREYFKKVESDLKNRTD
jgi:hypothetical protein